MILYTYFILFNVVMIVLSKNILIKTGLEGPLPDSVGLRFLTEISNIIEDDCAVEVYPDECCLDNYDSKCDVMEIIGGASEVIDAGASKTITMVAPLLDQFERKGYCTLYIDSRPVSRPKNVVRDTVKIKFDTKIKKGDFSEITKPCKHIDEDPLNDCNPVDCDTYYNGKKPHYSAIKKRCVAIPACFSKKVGSSKVAYNPVSNKCVYKPSVEKDDIEFIKKLTQSEKERMLKDVLIIKMVSGVNATNNTNLTDDIKFQIQSSITRGSHKVKYKENQPEKDKLRPKDETGKNKALNTTNADNGHTEKPKTEAKSKAHLCKLKSKLTKLFHNPFKAHKVNSILNYLSVNKYTMMILSAVVFLQCCLICTLAYGMSQRCGCCKKKKVINRFFNYRQDASVTTPLIRTSNIDTETTEYQYLSESSNYIDKKIKCYKACQKERKNNVKLSMSDDILSKCITRRDWHRLPRSETIPEVNDEELKAKEKKEAHTEQKKVAEMKVNFQEEYHRDKRTKPKRETKINKDVLNDSSERLIRCHSYNYDNPNVTGFRKSSTMFGARHQDKTNGSIEKGAQAYFSNDSMDDFLSERGVIFIGENASKYSYTSISSVAKSTGSSRSSKTSKNNIVKNVISLLSRKAKGPSSDPGVKKSKTELDLELLHISRASVFSSSNETDGGKELKRVKESTSSL